MKQLWDLFKIEAKEYALHTPIETLDYSINISLQNDYLYTETPKVACSSIKKILHKVELNEFHIQWDSFDDLHDRQFSPLLRPSQVRPLNSFFKGNRLFKFCFVRNPYARLLSAYLDKIVNNKPEKRGVLIAMGIDPANINHPVSFEEFVNIVCAQQPIQMNPHWRTQYHQTYQESIQYDVIGKFECLEKELVSILKKIKPSFDSDFIPRETRHATGANYLLPFYYTPFLEKVVCEKFKIDFEFFDYCTDLSESLS